MTRKASERDTQIYYQTLSRMDNANYSEAVRQVAQDNDLTPKGVYGMAHRAKNDATALSEVLRTLNIEGLTNAELSRRTRLTVKQIEEYLNGAQSVAPPVEAVPDSHYVKGVSSYFDGDGNLRGQWVKTDTKKTAWKEWIDVALNRVADIQPFPQVERDNFNPASGLTVFPVADLHLGLYASAQETGTEWTLAKAVGIYKESYRKLMNGLSIASGEALIANLGDFTHVDNLINRTPKSGAALDSSGRYAEVVEAAIDLSVYLIEMARNIFRHTHVVWLSGNHDEATGIVMQAALKRLFKYDQSVNIIEPQSRFYVHSYQRVALGFTHGDTVKPDKLPLLMATDYPRIWADAQFRVWHTGHVHHRTVQEYPGCIVESHGAPVPKDNWHFQSGYRANRSIQSITYGAQGESQRSYIHLRG